MEPLADLGVGKLVQGTDHQPHLQLLVREGPFPQTLEQP